uniref:CYCLIN domain-containing protein n=1 Tax=Caenorhabditis japonica TaxID=281687 RepID=A0A8R1ENV4_CAEJA
MVKPKEHNGQPEPKKDEEERYETSFKQIENLEIKASSFGKRPIYSKVDINCDKWLMTLDEDSRKKLDNPPSLADGVSKELEAEIRYLGCELIQHGAILLKLPQTAAATGQILFQRYYYQKSFVRYHFEHTVQACLLLASKIEEEPRRPREVYNVFHRLERLHRLMQSGHKITK